MPQEPRESSAEETPKGFDGAPRAGTFTWRTGDDGIPEVLLVTSRRTGEWIAPLGKIDPGETAEEAAVRETREEAGVAVQVVVPLDALTWHDAAGRTRKAFFFVARFGGDVEWDEAGLRERGWFSCDDAHEKIIDDFRDLLDRSAELARNG